MSNACFIQPSSSPVSTCSSTNTESTLRLYLDRNARWQHAMGHYGRSSTICRKQTFLLFHTHTRARIGKHSSHPHLGPANFFSVVPFRYCPRPSPQYMSNSPNFNPSGRSASLGDIPQRHHDVNSAHSNPHASYTTQEQLRLNREAGLPPFYICFRCNLPGHHSCDCSTNGVRIVV